MVEINVSYVQIGARARMGHLVWEAHVLRIMIVVAVLGVSGCRTASESGQPTPIEVISRGQALDLNQHLVEGQVTVFDFYADWCPPCKVLDKSLEDMNQLYAGRIAIRKLDLVSWDSELAKTFGIKDLPYLMFYDEQRKQVATGPSSDVLPKLLQHLNEG